MIQPNELRIGNYVYDRGGKILRIDMFEYDGFAMRQEVDGVVVHPLTEDFEYANPIPLTVVWLERFGFEKKGSNYFTHKDLSVIELGKLFTNLGEDYVFSTTRENRVHVTAKIRYVHQLQNAFFVLTGNELTIRP